MKVDYVRAYKRATGNTLTVSRAGTGSGSVSSNPAGISCGTTCSATFAAGSNVSLTATPAAGSTFTGWGGACSGTGACSVTMDAARNVTANFTSIPVYTLSVAKAGTGQGTVTSSPAGINCGATCSASFAAGTAVTLTPVAAAGSSFTGWSGACSGAGSCTVTVSGATTATASFTSGRAPYPNGTPWPVPGLIEAENYDNGVEGVTYHDTTAGNAGGAYRADGVDIQATTDADGGFNVGWTAAGEWLEYTVDVATTGLYSLEARVASLTAGGTFHVEVDGVNATGAVAFPATGGWQTWTTVTKAGVNLIAGSHRVRFVIDAAGFNVNWLRFNRTAGTIVRVECGSTVSYTDSMGNLWYPDQGFTGGTTSDRGTALAIVNTNDPRIFQTARFSMTSYAFAVTNGNYTVKLYLAETYAGITAAGQRVFDVNVEGVALTGVDPFKEAGGLNRALVRSVDVTVTDGQLNISFTTRVQNPIVQGIEIMPR